MHTVNERLYPAARPLVNNRARLVELFVRSFADEPDLAGLTPAARRVLATAAALFHERGAADTSVRELTRACGLTPGALYNHFASKDELLFTLVAHGHERMRRRIEEYLQDAPPGPEAAFGAFVRAYVVGHVQHPELAQTVRREYLHLSAARYQQVVELRRSLRARLTELIDAGRRAGVFALIPGDEDGVATTLMVLDMCSRTSEWWDRSRESDPEAIVERYVRGALRLVGRP